jgi:hypothetical protein
VTQHLASAADLRALRTQGQPVIVRRLTPSADGNELSVERKPESTEWAAALGIEGRPAVLVIVGGADELDKQRDHHWWRRDSLAANIPNLRKALDLGIAPAAAGAVVLTGGTHSGLMKLVGECFVNRGPITLVGVAPRAKIAALAPSADITIPTDQAVLDPHHNQFVLTAGQEWGSETETLLELAEDLAGNSRRGAVLLANGGNAARQEVQRFLEAGWPVIVLEDTGRAADELSYAWNHQSRWRVRHRITREWGDLTRAQIEVHRIARDANEILQRRLSWHCSEQPLLKSAWGVWSSYEYAARTGRRLNSRIQILMLTLTTLLLVGSVLFGAYYADINWLKWALVGIPVILAVGGTVADYVVPRRSWMVLRGAAENTLRSIYLYRAASVPQPPVRSAWGEQLLTAARKVLHPSHPTHLHSVSDGSRGEGGAAAALIVDLARTRQEILRSGVRSLSAPPIGRPDSLPSAFDELGALTTRAYITVRIEGQLTYYRRAAARLQRGQLSAIGFSALLAAIATAAATEAFAALWVPLLILVASVLVIAQQRVRWQERITLYSTALADLQAIRDSVNGRTVLPPLSSVVREVESSLDRERAGWLQSMGQSFAESRAYRQPFEV